MEKPHNGDPVQIPLIGWLTAALGLLLVLGATGLLFYESVAGDRTPPEITVRVVKIRARSKGAAVQFDAINKGGQAAAAVTIEGTLEESGREIESSETTIDYIPGHSTRSGGLFFDKDPRHFHLKLRAKGYQKP